MMFSPIRILLIIPLFPITISFENRPVVSIILYRDGINHLKKPFEHTFSFLEIDWFVPKQVQLEYVNPVQMSLNYIHPIIDGYLVQVKIRDQILYSSKRSGLQEQIVKERIIVKEATLTVIKTKSACTCDQKKIEMKSFYMKDGTDSGVDSSIETERIIQSICKLIEKNRARLEIVFKNSVDNEKIAENILSKYDHHIQLGHMIKHGGDKDKLFFEYNSTIDGFMNEVVAPSSPVFKFDKAKRHRDDNYMISICFPFENFLQLFPIDNTITVFKDATTTTKFSIKFTNLISNADSEEEDDDAVQEEPGGFTVLFQGPVTSEPAIESSQSLELRVSFIFTPSCLKFEVRLAPESISYIANNQVVTEGNLPTVEKSLLEEYFKEKVATVKIVDPYDWVTGFPYRKTRFEKVGSQSACFTMDFKQW